MSESKDMLDLLLEVVFDQNGNLRLNRIVSLLEALESDSSSNNKNLIPITSAGFKLLFRKEGSNFRIQFFNSLIKERRITISEVISIYKT